MTKRIVIAAVFASVAFPASASAVHGGHLASIGRFPWLAAVVRAGDGQYCGGAVIAPRVVLTAAHCITLAEPGTPEVVVGRSLLTRRRGGRRIRIIRQIAYPTYGRGGPDLGLLILRRAARVRPARLALAVRPPARLAGWGITSAQDDRPSDALRASGAQPLLARACRAAYPGLEFDNRIELCGTGGACSGDSGSPLIVGRAVVGVVSWGGDPSQDAGWDCTSAAYPTVYARITSGLKWIKRALARHRY